MDDALVVSGLQCVSDLAGNEQRFVSRDGALRDAIREGGTVHKFQDQRPYTVGLFEAVNVRDMRMIEGGECLCFAFEPRQSLEIPRERLGQDLQRDVTIQPRVARTIHLAHATGSERRQDRVRPERLARRERHRSGL